MDIAVTMVEHHVWLVGELIDWAGQHEHVLDVVVPAGGLSDDDGEQTARTLLNQLVGQLEMWLEAVDGTPSAGDLGSSPHDLRKRHAESGQRFTELVRRVVAQGRTAELFRDGPADHPGVFNYGGMIAHVLTFGAHRRALVIGALTSAGAGDLRYGDPMTYFAERRTD
jgi:AraC family transcriptional regulator